MQLGSGVLSWVMGVLIVLIVPIVLGEILWRRLALKTDGKGPPPEPGVLAHTLLFGFVGPPLGLAALLAFAMVMEQRVPVGGDMTDSLIALAAFSYAAGGVPALLCGFIAGFWRRGLLGWLGWICIPVFGALLSLAFLMATGLFHANAQDIILAVLCGVLGALGSFSIAKGIWRRRQAGAGKGK